jgi:hypothetical protein
VSTAVNNHLALASNNADPRCNAGRPYTGTDACEGSMHACDLKAWRRHVFTRGSVASLWEDSWPKTLGHVHLVAYLTRGLREGYLSRGTPVKLQRPPVLHKSRGGKRLENLIIRFSAEAKLPPQHCGSFASTAATATAAAVSSSAEGQQVEDEDDETAANLARYETCEGRLPSEVARLLAPLMDSGAISLQGRVCSAPAPAALSVLNLLALLVQKYRY